MANRDRANPIANNYNWPEECIRRLEMTGAISTPLGFTEYSSVLLSGDGFEDTYDSRLLARSSTTSLYFPGIQKIDKSHVARSVTIFHGQSGSPEITPSTLRTSLLGLSVGEAALHRYDLRPISKHVTPIDELAQKAKRSPVRFAEMLYGIWNVPLAVVSIRSLVRHKVAKPGTEIAVLYTPDAVAPQEGLTWLQDALR